ncbi:MAG: hypothetical protein GY944_27760 [bacterium]|nr:hypothetical protein [bacterium]
MTEAMALNDPDAAISDHFRPAPPSVPAAAIAWLAREGAARYNGQTVMAQKLVLERGLHPDWRVHRGGG